MTTTATPTGTGFDPTKPEPPYYAKEGVIHKRPVRTKIEGGESISIGFPVCKMLEYVGAEAAETVAELMNRGAVGTAALTPDASGDDAASIEAHFADVLRNAESGAIEPFELGVVAQYVSFLARRGALTQSPSGDAEAVRWEWSANGSAWSVVAQSTRERALEAAEKAGIDNAVVRPLYAAPQAKPQPAADAGGWQPVSEHAPVGKDQIVFCADTKEMFVAFRHRTMDTLWQFSSDPNVPERHGFCRPSHYHLLPEPPTASAAEVQTTQDLAYNYDPSNPKMAAANGRSDLSAGQGYAAPATPTSAGGELDDAEPDDFVKMGAGFRRPAPATRGVLEAEVEAAVTVAHKFRSDIDSVEMTYVLEAAAAAREPEPSAVEDAVAAEREACAKIAATEAKYYTNNTESWGCGMHDMAVRLAKTIRARASSPEPGRPVTEHFQARVHPWMMACFGPMIAGDREERNHRFLEEALELVQACGCTAHEAHQLVDYTFARPAGDPRQESGGVSVTHAALCLANGLDMHEAAETELARIWTKVDTIRAKQAAKPKHSPLPETI